VPAAVSLDHARMLAARGGAQEALEAVESVLASEPDNPAALLLKARLLLERRDGEAALALHRRAAELLPDSCEARDGLARCLHALGRDAEALEVARSARGLLDRAEGDNFRHAGAVYLTMVWCLRELRLLREALAVAEEGLSRCPDAILAQWASLVEEELAESEKEEC
jgi:tetratricopeptide (TPR) repeat protein